MNADGGFTFVDVEILVFKVFFFIALNCVPGMGV